MKYETKLVNMILWFNCLHLPVFTA